jgi:hypothetical protein
MSMTDSAHETTVIRALVERFEQQRLPHLLELRERVDRGEVLGDLDIRYLSQVFDEARQSKHIMDRHPEWQQFCSEVIHLFREITEKALKNEKCAGVRS